jgi:hypothetical protein
MARVDMGVDVVEGATAAAVGAGEVVVEDMVVPD